MSLARTRSSVQSLPQSSTTDLQTGLMALTRAVVRPESLLMPPASIDNVGLDNARSVVGAPIRRSTPRSGLRLPFVWRAMEWAKPDGQISFALHARLLFAQGDGMPAARQALFEALDVTSVVNGTELRQTKVWPHILAPFCILFGTNRNPVSKLDFGSSVRDRGLAQ